MWLTNAFQPSFVVAYVPSWLKFSYLSELLVLILVFLFTGHKLTARIGSFSG